MTAICTTRPAVPIRMATRPAPRCPIPMSGLITLPAEVRDLYPWPGNSSFLAQANHHTCLGLARPALADLAVAAIA
jgi:hypothetical protein